MADIASKVQVQIPELPLVDLDLSCQHLTTTNFMQLIVAYNREMPKGKIDYVGKSFAHLYAMAKPPLGSGRLQLSAFFVPYRTVWQPWTDFITDTPHNQPNGTSIISMAPTIQLDDLVDYFTTYVSTVETDATAVYDFDSGGTHYVLSEEGRWALKLFESLGYKILFNDGNDNFRYSALPLLCFAKAYLDYYFPNQYAHTGVFASLDGFFQRQTWYDLNSANIDTIVRACRYCCYDDNVLINAFDNPVGGANGTFSRDFQIRDISSFDYYSSGQQVTYEDNTLVHNTSNADALHAGSNSIDGTPFIGYQSKGGASSQNSVSYPPITEYSLHNLMALNDYIYRNALAGSRSLDRYLARYGKVLDSSKLQRSIWLGSSRVPLKFGEVVSTADTSRSALGDYAGVGSITDLGSHFTCETDEFGQFIVIATIVPDVVYYQGLDENVMHVSKLDFHTAEFDGIGNTPLRKANVMTSLQNSAANQGAAESVWAFASKYWEYKTKVDHLTGDFRLNTKNGGLMSFSMARMLPETGTFPSHNLDFILGKDANQFNRIFYNFEPTDKDVIDHFYVVFRNNVHAAFPVKKLYDSYDWHTDSKKEVKLDVNGAKVN